MTGDIALATAVELAMLMGATWLVSLVVRDASIVAIVWGPGFALVSWIACFQAPDARSMLVAGTGGAWWTVVGPLVMTALLMRYSGAGLLERTVGQRRPGYADYARRTNGFFPGPPG